MRVSLSRAALASAAALAAVLVPAGAASAQSLTIKDHTGDVWKDTIDQDGTETFTPAGSQLNTDLKRTFVKHTAHRVLLRGTYVELRKAGPSFMFGANLRTNEGLKRAVTVDTLSGRATAELTRKDGTPVACKGLRHSIDYAANQVTVSFPRTCLSNPRWLQAAVAAISMTDADFYVDNGQNETHREPWQWSARIHKA